MQFSLWLRFNYFNKPIIQSQPSYNVKYRSSQRFFFFFTQKALPSSGQVAEKKERDKTKAVSTTASEVVSETPMICFGDDKIILVPVDNFHAGRSKLF